MAGNAGRLSIEIVAEIARLQKDLDQAKRQVAAASRDIGRSASAANDNIGGMGRSMGGVNTMSRAMRANMINLGRQVQDVGTMFALGARPMQIFASQGAQIADVLVMMNAEAKATNTSLGRMAVGGLKRIGPIGLAATAIISALGVSVAHMRDEINETSDVTVTMGDVVLGTFDALAASARDTVVSAFDAMGIDLGSIWQTIVEYVLFAANRIVGVATLVPRMILAGWDMFPGAMADLFLSVVNAAIQAAEDLANVFINAANRVIGISNQIFDTGFDPFTEVDFGQFANNYRGQFQDFGAAMGSEVADTFTRDFIGDFAAYASPYIQDRARNRMAAEAEEAGGRAGQRGGRAMGREMAQAAAQSFEEAFAGYRFEETSLTQGVDSRISAINDEIAALEREARAVGLVGHERDRLLLILESEAEINDALARQRMAAEDGRDNEVRQLQALIDSRRELLDLQLAEIDSAQRQEAIDEYYQAHEDTILELADMWETLFTNGVDGLWDMFEREGLRAISMLASEWTLGLLNGNQQGGGPLGAIGGIFGSSNAGSVAKAANDNVAGAASGGGILGSLGGVFGGGGSAASLATPLGLYAAGFSLSNLIGGGIEKLTGLNFSKGGSGVGALFGLPGAILGGLVGGLFSGPSNGSTTVNGSNRAFVGGDEIREQSGSLADAAFDGISQIADALGASLNLAKANFTIGMRKDTIRFDAKGRGSTNMGKYPDIVNFGTDTEAAIAAAIADMLKDGVISGISQASLNILKAGKDLEAAIQKAILIESVPKLLAERLDPLGAALDAIDERFQTLADALREGRATAEQFAQAEQLYNLERKDAIEQFGQGARQLQEFLDSLAFGSNSPLSVRSQLASARNDFAQYEQAILAGETIDQSAFTASAQALLGLSRQANASSGAFFNDFDRIRELTEMAIGNSETGAIQDGSVVFMQQTAGNTQSIALQQEETNRLLREISNRLSNDNTQSGGGGFVGAERAFAR